MGNWQGKSLRQKTYFLTAWEFQSKCLSENANSLEFIEGKDHKSKSPSFQSLKKLPETFETEPLERNLR